MLEFAAINSPGAAFVAARGHRPASVDLHPAHGLPSYCSIKALFGNLAGYHRALGHPPRAHPPPAAPPATRPPPTRRRCLRCDRLFPSPHAGVRICPACHQDPAWHDADAGAWMQGTPVGER